MANTEYPSLSCPAVTGLSLPPGPARRLTMDETDGDPLQFLLGLTSEYGDIVRYETNYGPSYLINAPDQISRVFQDPNYLRGSLLKAVLGEGLLASEGQYWKQQRRMMQPAFQQSRMAGFASVVRDSTAAMLRRWRERKTPDEPIDISVEMARLTLEIVIAALFSGDLRSDADTLRESITGLMIDVGGLVSTEFGSPMKIRPARNAAFRETLATINRIVYAAIQDRRRRGSEGTDLLSLLLAGRDEDGRELDPLQLRDEVVTLVFAGSETSSMMLGWTSYLLGIYPETEARVRAEADAVLGGKAAQLADVADLKFTRMVVEESLRLYPPVWVIFRKAMADAELGGYRVTAGSKVIVSPYAAHRNPRYWPDPARFDPGRFSPEAAATRPRFAHVPFGLGKHICMGNALAMLEGQLVIAMVAQQFRLHPVPGHKVEPHPLVTLRQRKGILVHLEPRR